MLMVPLRWLDGGEVQTGYTYTEDTNTHELTVKDPSGTALATVKLLSTVTGTTAIANDLNVSMPDSAVVYHAAFKMLQDEYNFWQEARDYASGTGTTYSSLDAVFDAGIAVTKPNELQKSAYVRS